MQVVCIQTNGYKQYSIEQSIEIMDEYIYDIIIMNMSTSESKFG